MSVIIPTQGLCNRLRVILSYLVSNPELIIYWETDPTISSQHFLEIFQPIPNFSFIYTKPLKCLYSGYSQCLPTQEFQHNYLLLRPNINILKRIKNIILFLGTEYNACHIRRTDHTRLALKKRLITTDIQFSNYIKSSDKRVYLATDNKATQIFFLKLFRDKIIINDGIKLVRTLRQSNLEDALVDLIICSKSVNFMGSGYSSFSSTIETLKKINYFDTIILPLINDLDK